ncbi:hypothetical protein NCS52_01418400 [Fusarium sp. LHS14.1]|nr:hypothetical protein NCS52_01418400 [Fusarium sp. LHS14.1]
MAKQTSAETDERAAAWIPWLSWLLEHPEAVVPEVNNTQSVRIPVRCRTCDSTNGSTVDWVYADPYDAECGTLPRECMDPDFLVWVNSEGRHLMEDNPEAVKGVTEALSGLDRDRAAAEAKDKLEKTEEEPVKNVTQNSWTFKNLIFPKLSF